MILVDIDEITSEISRVGIVSVGSVLECLNSAKRIEIVKCKDCKYRVEGSKMCQHPKAVGWDALEPDDDDFCSYGEVRSIKTELEKFAEEIIVDNCEHLRKNGCDKFCSGKDCIVIRAIESLK